MAVSQGEYSKLSLSSVYHRLRPYNSRRSCIPDLENSNTVEQSLQFGLDICCSQDCFPVNSSRQIGTCHWLSVFRPFPFERPHSRRRIWRSVGSLTLKMAQQHRLKTGSLPDDYYTVIERKPTRSISALRIALSLIEIQKREAFHERTAFPLEQIKASYRHLDARQWIAGSGPKFVNIQVHRQFGTTDQVLQQASITSF